MRNRGWHKLAVVPLTREAGGTYVSIHLALALARQQHTNVVLMDMDLGNPSLARELGIPGCDSVTDTLRKGRPLADLICTIEELPNLAVLAPGQAEPEAAELLQDEQLAAALGQLGDISTNTVVIMDGAALLGEDAALAGIPLADALLLVADGRNGTSADMAHADRLLVGMPPVMGVVLNKSED
ncbi:chromosome partitioning protein [Paracoccus laeviglucosivorans]|nr:chromosome partitioning protein [Paracoccus laeviglucosivorans]